MKSSTSDLERARPVTSIAGWGVLLVAAALWVIALTRTSIDYLGPWGLLPAFPILWYVAAAFTFAVCLLGLSYRSPGRTLMCAAVGLLNMILYASPNLIENAPRLPWVYKHIAVVRYIDTFGSVDPSIDLYNRWPGFFSLSAFLGDLTGYRNPVSYAAWAEVGFSILDAIMVLAIARTISRQPRFYWTATMVFTICDWVGQNYFSPQAFSLSLYLLISLIMLKYLRGRPRRLAMAIERLAIKMTRGTGVPDVEAQREAGAPRSIGAQRRVNAGAVAAVLVLYAVIVMSHQLTPYLLIFAVLPLTFLGYIRNLWLGLALVAMAILYLLPNLSFVARNYGLFSGFDPVANATYSPVNRAQLSVAAVWQGRGVLVLTAITVAFALVGFIRHFRNRDASTAIIVAWLAVAPGLTLLFQTYGGEGKYRAFLFGLPWYAIGVAWFFWSGRRKTRSNGARLGCVATLTVMAVLFVATSYQPEADYRVPASDVVAAEWLDGHIKFGDTVITAAGSFPVLIGPHYPYLLAYNKFTAISDYLSNDANQTMTPADLQQIIANVGTDQHSSYLIFSKSQTDYAVAHGLLASGELEAIEQGVRLDPRFPVVYTNVAVRVYRYQ